MELYLHSTPHARFHVTEKGNFTFNFLPWPAIREMGVKQLDRECRLLPAIY